MNRDEGFVPWPEEAAARYRSLGLWRGVSLWAQLKTLAGRHDERIALVDARRRSSYAELAWRAETLAQGLHGLGIRPGDAVVVQLPNCIELVELYFALFRLGARPVTAQLAHRRLELTHFAQKTRAVWLSLLGISWFWFFGASFLTILPGYAQNTLGAHAHVVTLFLSVFCIGIALGSLFTEKVSGKNLELGLVPLGSIGMTLFTFDLFLVGAPPSPDHALG